MQCWPGTKAEVHNKNHNRTGHASKPRFRCFICNAEGHKAIDCLKNPNKRQEQKNQQDKSQKTEKEISEKGRNRFIIL